VRTSGRAWRRIDAALSSQAIDQPARGAIGEAGVHLVEEILGFDEEAPVAVLQRFDEHGGGQTGLAHGRLANENDIGCPRHEVELGELADLGTVDAGLLLERKRLQGPAFRQVRPVDAVLHGLLAPVEVLLAQEPGEPRRYVKIRSQCGLSAYPHPPRRFRPL
jgi:hypothetical protein